MSALTGRGLRVIHLDHTIADGGAELGLQRMFVAGPTWNALLQLPPTDGDGAFTLRGAVPLTRAGVRQPAGVSAGGFRVAGATLRLIAQAIATRWHRAFRGAHLIAANTSRSAAYAALAISGSRIPFVVHLRDMVDRQSLGRAGFEIMTRLVLPRADGVVSDTRATLSSAAPYIRPDTLTSIIASASGLVFDQARTRRGPDSLRVGMLARLDPWKGQMLLLDAFADSLAQTGAVLEFAGGAPFGHEPFLLALRERADERGIADQVVFLGHVDDVDRVLATWDIAVHYSTRPEPLGQNVLQYLAAGCATIVADEGGPVEFVDGSTNGLRVAPRDVGALAAALGRLAEDASLRDQLSAAAPSTPGLQSDAEVTAAHGAFYARVAASRPARRTHRNTI